MQSIPGSHGVSQRGPVSGALPSGRNSNECDDVVKISLERDDPIPNTGAAVVAQWFNGGTMELMLVIFGLLVASMVWLVAREAQLVFQPVVSSSSEAARPVRVPRSVVLPSRVTAGVRWLGPYCARRVNCSVVIPLITLQRPDFGHVFDFRQQRPSSVFAGRTVINRT